MFKHDLHYQHFCRLYRCAGERCYYATMIYVLAAIDYHQDAILPHVQTQCGVDVAAMLRAAKTWDDGSAAMLRLAAYVHNCYKYIDTTIDSIIPYLDSGNFEVAVNALRMMHLTGSKALLDRVESNVS